MAGGPSFPDPGRVLVAGGRGLLGSAVGQAMSGANVLGHRDLDVTDPASCGAALERFRPAVVINCAAYTKVDQAEDEEARAWEINALGAWNLGRAAAAAGARVVYFSTDFVFDGRGATPRREDEAMRPLSAYGRTKLAGELATAAANPDHLILRTAWLFGPHGPNFVDTILRLARERGELRVVDDQVGSPTFTRDIAAALASILALDLRGTYHLVNAGETSWFGLAVEAVRLAGVAARTTPVTTAEFPRKAVRPARSVLDTARLAAHGVTMRPWNEALAAYLAEGHAR